MKPAAFRLHQPSRLDETLHLLRELGAEAKILAGGQSLVPLLNMRLAAPEHLIDINGVQDLAQIEVSEDGVRVGALSRHSEVEDHEQAYDVVPLLRQGLRHVAHRAIRNRGTTVGSLAHADPSGEMTAVLALLGGHVELRSAGRVREVSADEFFVGPLQSCAEPSELATWAFFPRPSAGSGSAWVEVSRRHGDYAICGVGALITADKEQRIVAARTAYTSVDGVPLVLDLTDAVIGQSVRSARWADAGRLASASAKPDGDIHASAEYRLHLVEVLTSRALGQAAASARLDAKPDLS